MKSELKFRSGTPCARPVTVCGTPRCPLQAALCERRRAPGTLSIRADMAPLCSSGPHAPSHSRDLGLNKRCTNRSCQFSRKCLHRSIRFSGASRLKSRGGCEPAEGSGRAWVCVLLACLELSNVIMLTPNVGLVFFQVLMLFNVQQPLLLFTLFKRCSMFTSANPQKS